MKTALICGISGQDGVYLAQLLLNKYRVCRTSRTAQVLSLSNLVNLGIRDRVKLESLIFNDFQN